MWECELKQKPYPRKLRVLERMLLEREVRHG
jgi:hypothetical protein